MGMLLPGGSRRGGATLLPGKAIFGDAKRSFRNRHNPTTMVRSTTMYPQSWGAPQRRPPMEREQECTSPWVGPLGELNFLSATIAAVGEDGATPEKQIRELESLRRRVANVDPLGDAEAMQFRRALRADIRHGLDQLQPGRSLMPWRALAVFLLVLSVHAQVGDCIGIIGGMYLLLPERCVQQLGTAGAFRGVAAAVAVAVLLQTLVPSLALSAGNGLAWLVVAAVGVVATPSPLQRHSELRRRHNSPLQRQSELRRRHNERESQYWNSKKVWHSPGGGTRPEAPLRPRRA